MEQLKQLLTAAGIAYKENEPLAAHCTFKIGGPARLFVQPVDLSLIHICAVKLSESLDLVVQLEAWDPTKNYQRTGLESEYYDILGVSIPSTSIRCV